MITTINLGPMPSPAAPTPAGLAFRCGLTLIAAFGLFTWLFLGAGNRFWLCLSGSVLILCTLAVLAEADGMRDTLRSGHANRAAKTLGIGVLSALVLYAIFYAGNLAARQLFPFGAAEIEAVYRQGARTPRWIVALLLLMVVGPGEEFFWRGYVQRRLTANYGRTGTLLAVLAYTGVHLATVNLTLILAALVCGAFWATLYRLYDSVWINIVSHGVWAAAIFVWFPMA